MISDESLKALWDTFGELHVNIQDRRNVVNMIRHDADGPADTHLLDGLGIKLDEMDKVLNEANLFIKDFNR